MTIDKKLLIVLLYFFVFSILFVFTSPVFETPDEDLHLQYINYISVYKSLLNQYEGMKNPDMQLGQGHQHPLYYIITGSITDILHPKNRIQVNGIRNKLNAWNGGSTLSVPCYNHLSTEFFPTDTDKNLFYVLRILSVFFSFINIIFIYKIAKPVFPDSDWKYLPVILVATLPQFLFITGSINSNNLAGMFSTIIIYLIFKILRDNLNTKNYILLGIFLGFGILTKKTLLFSIPGLVFMFGYILHNHWNYKKYVKNFSITFLITILICTWFFFRNYYVYGGFLGTQVEIDTMPNLLNSGPVFPRYFFEVFLPQLYQTFIGRFGWMNLGLPKFVYVAYLFIFLLAFVGLVKLIKRDGFKNHHFLFAFLFALFCFAGIVYFNITFIQFQGRYMFPVLSLLALLFCWGIKEFTDLSRNKYFKKIITILIFGTFVIIDIVSILISYQFYHNLANYL